MAGYITLFQGRVYEGLFTAAEAMPNGIWVEKTYDADAPNGFTVAPLAAAYDADATVAYFLENEYDVDWDSTPLDFTAFECKAGDYCRMHRMLAGEEVIMTVDQAVFDAATTIPGATFTPAVGGSVTYVGAPGAASGGPLRLVEKVLMWGLPALRLATDKNM